jgi:hypothetical protein
VGGKKQFFGGKEQDKRATCSGPPSMPQSTVDAAVARLMAVLQVLCEAPPELLAAHADALNVALWTIDRLVVEVERSGEPA